MLCEACTNALRKQAKPLTNEKDVFMCTHHATVKDLERAAVNSCLVCFEVWNSFTPLQRDTLLDENAKGVEYGTHALMMEPSLLGLEGSSGAEVDKMFPKDGFFFTVGLEEKRGLLEKLGQRDDPAPTFVLIAASGS